MTSLLLFLVTSSCGTKNLGDCPASNPLVKCTEPSTDEQIRRALNNEDLEEAKTLLLEAIAAEPSNYDRYPMLSAVYAGLAGFDLLGIVKQANFSGSSNLTEAMDAFLPNPAGLTRDGYRDRIDIMGEAIGLLSSLPADFIAESATNKFAASAVQQQGLYQAAQASMYMKLFTFNFETGTADPGQLSAMTDADAAAIMAVLADAAAGDGLMAAVAAATLSAINAGGGTLKDNLASFLGG